MLTSDFVIVIVWLVLIFIRPNATELLPQSFRVSKLEVLVYGIQVADKFIHFGHLISHQW